MLFVLRVKSPIDRQPMDGIPSIRVHNGIDYKGTSRFIRWTEVFIINVCLGRNIIYILNCLLFIFLIYDVEYVFFFLFQVRWSSKWSLRPGGYKQVIRKYSESNVCSLSEVIGLVSQCWFNETWCKDDHSSRQRKCTVTICKLQAFLLNSKEKKVCNTDLET